MTRRSIAKTTKSPTDQYERQARRLSRQQKQLEKQMIADIEGVTTVRSRTLRLTDIKNLEPLTDTQAQFFEAYENNDADAYVLYGSAGTGKTTLAIYFALIDLLSQDTPIDKIIIVRSAVNTRDMGFLPGTEEEKSAVYEAPYQPVFEFLTGRKDSYEKLKDTDKVEFRTTSNLRGLTFDNSVIIVDEAQSMNWHEASTIATRCGKNTKMIFCGDGAQNDLIYNKNDQSGFRDFIAVSRAMSEFRHFKFTPDDIVRSGFVKSWIINCEKLGLV